MRYASFPPNRITQTFPMGSTAKSLWKTSIGPPAKACGDLESAAYRLICEHLQEPRNAGSRPKVPLFNTLLICPLHLSLDELLQLRSLAVFGMPRNHLVGDAAGSC